MEASYYLENITDRHNDNPRIFLKPSAAEISDLRVGELVRLFFVLNFETEDHCRAERMWVEIKEFFAGHITGYLTNEPVYIKDLKRGDVVSFRTENIAATIVKALFDDKQKAIITQRAFDNKQVNWVLRDEPNNEQDSGWQLFYGDEDEAYLEDAGNARIIALKDVLGFEPRLEKAFASAFTAFEWDEESGDFKEVVG